MAVLGSKVSSVCAVDLYLEWLKSMKGGEVYERLKLQTNYTQGKLIK